MEGFKEVSLEEFYSVIGPKDVNGRIVSGWPYRTELRDSAGRVHGIIQSTDKYGPNGDAIKFFYLPA